MAAIHNVVLVGLVLLISAATANRIAVSVTAESSERQMGPMDKLLALFRGPSAERPEELHAEPPEDLHMGSGTVRLGKALGAGSFGQVLKGTASCNIGEQDVAVKNNVDYQDRVENEFRLLEVLDHPNIIKVFGHTEPQLRSRQTMEWVTIGVMEFANGGDLDREIDRRDRDQRELRHAQYALELSGALEYLHNLGVVHHDIKGANVVIADGHLKLADFGFACCRHLSNWRRDNLTFKLAEKLKITNCKVEGYDVPMCDYEDKWGTLTHISPSYLKTRGATSRDDLWSVGVLLHELVHGQLPLVLQDTMPKDNSSAAYSKSWSDMAGVSGHIYDAPLYRTKKLVRRRCRCRPG
jgi:serine/threonine protein kinase